ncbi:MAG: YdbL family protein [Pseudomonadales bacterium]
MKNIYLTLSTLLIALCFSATSWALSLGDAKAQGLVGETSQGYIASVTNAPNSAVKALVSTINQKRKAAYQSRAAKAGVSLDVMAKRVAQRLQQKAAKGSYFRNASGKWVRK